MSMRSILIPFILFTGGLAPQALSLPDNLHCRQEADDGSTLLQTFTFTQLPFEVIPPLYNVRLWESYLPASKEETDPHAPVSSNDPIEEDLSKVLLDQTVRGRGVIGDDDLIYFLEGGFIRVNSGTTGFEVVYQLGAEEDLARIATNCVVQEIGMGIVIEPDLE